ncbi:hypothetical protein RHMOL_Rhmol11G0253400 [Rhododendron molle]|uniref:Uncharacterized protein n=2 Tax=Rhododendron molle TaxID=49168 RepID=A0ACC0LVZ2_RHOML|nr:hypothetical protein RHMOL_Rhmol11G0253400 [Rhododendron molle]KAI8532901.1 hypothetical protein RHMOL_Rhmol11G0253400 [Rhododendron molle]
MGLSFFKVFMPSNSSERLLIPLDFIAQVEGRIPNKAFLRNCHGKLWPVKVTKARNHFHFSDGWPKFVEDGSLDLGEFLVFNYDGTSVFYVKIFERTGCLKEVIGSSYITVNEEEEKEEEEEEEEDKDEEEEEEEEKEEEDMEVEKCSEEHGDAVDEQELESTPLRCLLDSVGNKGKVAVKVEDNEDVFEHGIVSRPKNPYFVAKLRQKRRNELFIPTDVIRVHRLELPKNLIILDEEGRKLSSKVIRWNDGRTWLTKGWKAFCKWNYLKREDRCICEFVHGEGSDGIYLKMRILREGSWLPK